MSGKGKLVSSLEGGSLSTGRRTKSKDSVGKSPRKSSSSSRNSNKSLDALERQESKVTAAEAASKLSFNWPPPNPDVKARSARATAKPPTEGPVSPRVPAAIRVNTAFMNEMRDLLHNTEMIKKGLSQSQGTSPRSRPLKVTHPGPVSSQNTLNMTGLTTKLNHISPTSRTGESRQYKPSVPPKWEDVETMWPGFDRQPIPNWQERMIPDWKQPPVKVPERGNLTPRSRNKETKSTVRRCCSGSHGFGSGCMS